MVVNTDRPENLNSEDLARLLLDMTHRLAVHYGLWFAETERQLGKEKALDLITEVYSTSSQIQMKRLGEVLGFRTEKGIPDFLLQMPKEKVLALMDATAKNWLANDGLWFQAVEFNHGMDKAKGCNDTCWGRFSPFEARSIKNFLGLPEQSGLEGLKKALKFRLYARLNVQSIVEETENSFVFQMNQCRVQSARQRKGLPDYPCKSAGSIEYPTFAREIDSRIITECVGCPPDEHPEEWFCAWKFILT